MSSGSTPTTIVPPGVEDDEYFPRGSLRNSTSLRVVESSMHVVNSSASAHHAIVEDEEDILDTTPPTPRDPFMTPAASMPGSTYNLAGATASRLSIHSPMYHFSDIANAGSRRSLDQRKVRHASSPSADITDAPPVPALPASLARASRSYVGISEMSPGSPAPAHYGKRESFQAPPPMVRPSSAGLSVPGHTGKRLSAQRPSTSGTTGSNRSAADLSPPQSSSGSMSEKDAMRSVAFHLDEVNRAMKGGPQKRMRSSMLAEGEEAPKPWLTAKNTRARLSYWLTFGVAILGIVASFFRIFYGARSVQLLKGNLCMVLDDDFNGPEIDTSKWSWEVEMDGFG